MRFAFIDAEKARHAVTILCRCLQVTRSGFHAWAKRGLSARAQRDRVLRTKLRAFHAASDDRYGRLRLWKDLKEDGEAVSEKRVRRLMRDEGLQGKVPKRFKQTTDSHHDDPIAVNLLDRDFTAAAPNQRWVGDTTEFVIARCLVSSLNLHRRLLCWDREPYVADRGAWRTVEQETPDLTRPAANLGDVLGLLGTH
jgi:hypothetical protein